MQFIILLSVVIVSVTEKILIRNCLPAVEKVNFNQTGNLVLISE